MNKNRPSFLLEQLEPRLLFSADTVLLPVDSPMVGDIGHDVIEALTVQTGSASTFEQSKVLRNEIVFIDASIEDYQQLARDFLNTSCEDRQVEVVVLDTHLDGIDQMTTYLDSHQDVSAIHIISHGTAGEISLGNTFLNLETLDTYAERIAHWQDSLAADADLLFYGCNLTADVAGQNLVRSIGFLTGADVAASNDFTGATELGGDWSLETKIGQIETQTVRRSDLLNNWQHVLGVTNPLWLTTSDHVSDGGQAGTANWNKGDIVQMEQPDLAFAPTPTDGTFSVVFDIDQFSPGDKIAAVHYVTTDILIGTNSFQLQSGDLLLTGDTMDLVGNSVLPDAGFSNLLTVQKEDVFVFRPDNAGDYGTGSFALLLEDPVGTEIWGLSLIEKETIVGDVTLDAGDFLFSRKGGEEGNDIWLYATGSVGSGTTVGSSDVLIEGDDLGVSIKEKIYGIDLVESTITIGGRTLESGTILASLDHAEGIGSGDAVGVTEFDIFALEVTQTTLGSGAGNAQVTPSLFFVGDDVAFDEGKEKLDGFTLTVEHNQDPVLTLAGTPLGYVVGDPATVIDPLATVEDSDSGDFDGGALHVRILAGHTLGDRLSVVSGGTVSLSGSDVLVGGLTVGTIDPVENGGSNVDLIIHWNANSSVAAVEAVLRQVSFHNTLLILNSTTQTVSFVLTDGDGGSSEIVQTSVYFVTANRPPQVTLPGAAAEYTENSSPIIIDSGATVADDDDTDMAGGVFTASVTVNASVFDALGILAGGNVTLAGSDVLVSGVVVGVIDAVNDGSADKDLEIVWNGSSSAATIQDVLRQISYSHSSDDLSNLTRTVSFSLTDGDGGSSIAVTQQVQVSPLNDAPSVSGTHTLAGIDEDSISAPIQIVTIMADPLVVYNDPDGDNLGIAVFSTTGLGSWEYSDDGVSGWTAFGMADPNSALLLLPDSWIRYVADGANGETAGFDFRAWDQTTGIASEVGIPNYGDTVPGGGETAYSSGAAAVSISVSSVNDAPVLDSIGNQSVDELTELTFTASASDADLPANILTYSLDATSLGKGMNINASTGEVNWTPAENQDGDHTVTLTVTDNGSGNLSDSETFTVTVNEVNVAPILAFIGSQSIDELTELTFTASASDADLPTNTLTYSLDAASLAKGITINAATGDVSWTPTENQDGDHTVTLTVTDNGSGNLSDSETFTVTVNEVNVAPILASISNQSVDELTELTFTASASDADLPTNTLTYSLDAASLAKGMTINAATGDVSWTPTENQDGDHTVTLTVTDNGSGNLSDSETFTVTVNEVNVAPVLGAIGNQSIDELTELAFSANASDVDLPVNTLTYSLDATSLAKGMTINAATGDVSWTPTEGQDGDHTVTLTVTDNGSGNLSDSETFTISVAEVNVAPVLDSIGNQSVDELTELIFTANANDNDLPANTLSYSLDFASQAKGMAIDSLTGEVRWTPTEGQDGDHTVTLTVTDNGSGNLSDSETFTVTVNEVNVAPILASIGNQSVDELTELTFTASASDADLPTNTLTYSLDAASLAKGMTINAATGDVSWTPTEGQDGDHTVTLTVTDNGSGNLSDSETFTVTVNEVNVAPVLDSIGSQSIDELTELTFTASASDADLPTNTLTYSLDAASLAKGITINAATGDVSWTPTENQDGDHTVTLTVTDNGSGNLSDSETFTVTVNEVNVAPILASIGNQSVDELTELTFTASASDADLPTNTLTYSLDAASLAKGMTINAATGDVSWTPTEGQDGDHTVTLTVTDNGSGNLSDSETFTISVAEVNVAPTVADDNFLISEDTVLSINSLAELLANDADSDGNPLSIVSIGQPNHGDLHDLGDGTLQYTPSADFNGNDSFTYEISDGHGGTATGRAFIVVTAVGDTPSVDDAAVTVGQMSDPIVVHANNTDGAEVTHFRISAITDGQLYLADGMTEVHDGNFITVAQGLTGLRFLADGGVEEGRFNVESSEDGHHVSAQSGHVTSTVSVVPLAVTTPAPVIDVPVDPEVEIVDDTALDESEVEGDDSNTILPVPQGNVPSISSTLKESSVSTGPVALVVKTTSLFNDDLGLSIDGKDRAIGQVLSLLLDKLKIDTLDHNWNQFDISPLTLKDYDLVRGSFEKLEDEFLQEDYLQTAVISSAVATSIGLSAGYVVWMLKGGSLLASVLSSMPAWHLADPLSILSGMQRDDDDDESLESIIKEREESVDGNKDKDDGGDR